MKLEGQEMGKNVKSQNSPMLNFLIAEIAGITYLIGTRIKLNNVMMIHFG